ncbi:glucosamine kinase GpsK [Vibrio maritimus]|uniref:Glucosamine kinase GpsK n=1 Tax=Vibrio maritimus TaxID=990268 RepID=A0A090SJ25_9VIBR|nr:glucosamine kinase GpsK [Vibrio maritimus]
MARYKVGIDGGGTSCRARIINEQQQVIGEAKSGSANIMLGAELALTSIIEAIESAAQSAGLGSADFARWMLAARSRGPSTKAAIKRLWRHHTHSQA